MTQKEAIEYTIKLAKKATDKEIRPNPFVGAVILDQDGKILGEGYHQKIGGPHAEVNAIEDALKKIKDLRKTTLFVSLEPCSHFGKTPPCCDFIIKHGIKKVVIASLDPNPKVNSVEKLKQNGIEVEVMNVPEAILLNRRFFTQHLQKRPYFILKTASTIDGKIADRSKESKWISNEKSRRFVHVQLRTNADAILTSYKTIIQDKASLTIRIDKNPIIETNVIIIDKELSLLKEEYASLPIFYKRTNTKIYFISNKNRTSSQSSRIEFIKGSFNEDGLIFSSIAASLLEKGLFSILTEGGNKINTSLIEQKFADELYWFIAPKILNDQFGVSMLGKDKSRGIQDTYNLDLINVNKIDDDVMLHYHFKS